jgi:Integrase core domain
MLVPSIGVCTVPLTLLGSGKPAASRIVGAMSMTCENWLRSPVHLEFPPHVPLSHPFVERLIGTMRREFLDQVLFWNARDLERKLADFQAYYNAARSHASLEGHTPLTFAGGHTAGRAELNNVRWVSHCRNLVQLPVAA